MVGIQALLQTSLLNIIIDFNVAWGDTLNTEFFSVQTWTPIIYTRFKAYSGKSGNLLNPSNIQKIRLNMLRYPWQTPETKIFKLERVTIILIFTDLLSSIYKHFKDLYFEPTLNPYTLVVNIITNILPASFLNIFFCHTSTNL